MNKEMQFYVENGHWPGPGPKKRPRLWWVFVAMMGGYWILGGYSIANDKYFLPLFPIAMAWAVVWVFIMARQLQRLGQWNRRKLFPYVSPRDQPPHPRDDPASHWG